MLAKLRGCQGSLITLRAAVSCLALAATACERNATEPPRSIAINLEVQFPQAPTALTTLTATLTSTQTTATLTFAVVSGTSGRVWTGSGSVATGTYTVDLQGRDENSNLIYRGSGTITVSTSGATYYFAMVCVSSVCEGSTGTVTLVVLIPQPEVEPNNNSTSAQSLTIFTYAGGQLQYALVNGIIASADSDYFAVTFSNIAAGDSIFVNVLSSRFGSSLDPVATLFNPSGTEVANVDDTFGYDPVIAVSVASAASSATYRFRVRGYLATSTGRYTAFAYYCRPAGTNSVFCR